MINTAIYNINFKRYAQRLMSATDKNLFWVKWLAVWAGILDNIQSGFRSFTIRQRADCFGNSQTGLLAARLNQYYDPVFQRIYIVNNSFNNPVPLEFHFTVYVPTTLPVGNINEIHKFIDLYVLLDKYFNIIQI